MKNRWKIEVQIIQFDLKLLTKVDKEALKKLFSLVEKHSIEKED